MKRSHKFTNIKIADEYIDEVLTKADYKKHWNGTDYIRDLTHHTRYHAKPTKPNEVEFHMDKTVNGLHVVANWGDILNAECKRIKKIWQTIDPVYLRMKLHEAVNKVQRARKKKKRRGEYAPNLMELQRNHRTDIIRPEPSKEVVKIGIFKRLKLLISRP